MLLSTPPLDEAVESFAQGEMHLLPSAKCAVKGANSKRKVQSSKLASFASSKLKVACAQGSSAQSCASCSRSVSSVLGSCESSVVGEVLSREACVLKAGPAESCPAQSCFAESWSAGSSPAQSCFAESWSAGSGPAQSCFAESWSCWKRS